jgi:hypothetical protein
MSAEDNGTRTSATPADIAAATTPDVCVRALPDGASR